MTPKEKAEKLLQKYYVEVLYGNESDYSDKQLRVFKIKAKTCSLIAVDEILSFIEDDRESFSWKTYYQEVKQEIEKL